MRNLNELTEELGQAYDSWKSSEKDKDNLRKEFFQFATERHKTSSLAQRIEIVTAPDEHQARACAEQLYPTWEVRAVDPEDEDHWAVLIEENPVYKEFSYVNSNDGRVYTRQIVVGSPLLDDERIQAEDPALWEQISRYSDQMEIVWDRVFDHLHWDDQGIAERLCDDLYAGLGLKRELKPLEELTSEQLAAIQEYIYYGKPTVKFPAPRVAKPEELPIEA